MDGKKEKKKMEKKMKIQKGSKNMFLKSRAGKKVSCRKGENNSKIADIDWMNAKQ